jgi:hypothetical protein
MSFPPFLKLSALFIQGVLVVDTETKKISPILSGTVFNRLVLSYFLLFSIYIHLCESPVSGDKISMK